MKKALLLTCLMFVVIFRANVASSQSSSDYKTKIEGLEKDLAKNLMDGNTEKVLSLYAADAISLPSYHPLEQGLDAIRKASEEMSKSGFKYISFSLTPLTCTVNGNQVTEIGTYTMSGQEPNVDKPIEDHGKYLTIWEKQKDGSLKIKVETWNSDINPMSMANPSNQQRGTGK